MVRAPAGRRSAVRVGNQNTTSSRRLSHAEEYDLGPAFESDAAADGRIRPRWHSGHSLHAHYGQPINYCGSPGQLCRSANEDVRSRPAVLSITRSFFVPARLSVFVCGCVCARSLLFQINFEHAERVRALGLFRTPCFCEAARYRLANLSISRHNLSRSFSCAPSACALLSLRQAFSPRGPSRGESSRLE